MVLNVKAFLEKGGDVKGEIRRFQVASDSSELYQQLIRKVCEIFSLSDNQFRLHWQDSDGDFVTFSSTGELMEAVKHSQDGVLRVFVKLTGEPGKNVPPCGGQGDSAWEKTQDEKVYHPGVICDGCDGQIYGPRYKCVICPDYDLCSICEQKGIHPEHDKFKITHPHTGGGAGGFMPPHFRRWMHRFMKKCQSENGQAPAGASASSSFSSSSSSSSSTHSSSSAGAQSASGGQQRGNCPMGATDEEFLKDIGANISAFLDPFGIDVTYEVHNDGDKKKGSFQSRSGTSCRGGPIPGMWNWGMFGNGGGCTRMPQGAPSCSKEAAEKPTEKPTEKPADKPDQTPDDSADTKEKSSEVEIPVTMDEDIAEPAEDAPDSKEASPTRSHEEDWTMINEGETTTDGKETGSGNVQRDGLYPSLKVVQSVEMMKAMGFNDDGGWLTRLLTSTDGDIAQALDTLKLSAEQAGRLA